MVCYYIYIFDTSNNYLFHFLDSLNRDNYKKLIISLLFIDSIQTMFFNNAIREIGYGLIHAVLMLSIGYYIKKFDYKIKKSKSILISIFGFFFAGAINLGWLFLFGARNKTIMDYNSIFIVIASVFVFLVLISIKIKNSYISKIAIYIFPVYLINDHPVMREVLYSKIYRCSSFYISSFMILHLLFFVVSFFIFSITISFLVNKYFIKRISKMEGIIFEKGTNYFRKISSWI